MELHRNDRGLEGVELGMGLLSLAILALLAIPLLSRIGGDVVEVGDAAAGRATTIETVNQDVRVAGVQLDRSTDGATCTWTIGSAGATFGVWQLGTQTLYGQFASKPAVCPTALDAPASGFAPLTP